MRTLALSFVLVALAACSSSSSSSSVTSDTPPACAKCTGSGADGGLTCCQGFNVADDGGVAEFYTCGHLLEGGPLCTQ